MKITVVSGGFDPIHIGHVRYITGAEKLGGVVILILNSDRFLDEKKKDIGGKFYPSIRERLAIMKWGLGIRFGSGAEVVECIDEDMTVAKTLTMIRKNYPKSDITFAKGGDRRNNETMPENEIEACRANNIEIVYGVGGFDKPQSSRWLVDRAKGGI